MNGNDVLKTLLQVPLKSDVALSSYLFLGQRSTVQSAGPTKTADVELALFATTFIRFILYHRMAQALQAAGYA